MTPEEKEFNDLLLLVGQLMIFVRLLPIIISIIKWQYLNRSMKILGYYLIVVMVSNLLEKTLYWSFNEHYQIYWKSILDSLQITDTNFLNIVGRVIDYVFVGWIFSFVIINPLGDKVKKYSWWVIPIAISIYFWIDGFRNYGTVNAILNRIYLVIIPAFYFWYLFNSPPSLSLWKNSFFIFGLGLFIPNIFGLMMSFTGDKLYETDFVAFVKISIFRNCLTILAQFLFAYAFYQAKYAKYLVKVG